MKNFIVLLLSLCSHISYAQLVSWNLAGPVHSNGREASLPATVVKDGLTASELIKGELFRSKQGSARGFGGHLGRNVKGYDDAKANNAYFEFAVTIDKGYTSSFEKINYRLRVQEFSAKNFQWSYSLDNGATFQKINDTPIVVENIHNNGSQQDPLLLSKIKALQNLKGNTKVIFRLYTWGNDNSQDKTKISVGFGKSDVKNNSPVLELLGSLEKK